MDSHIQIFQKGPKNFIEVNLFWKGNNQEKQTQGKCFQIDSMQVEEVLQRKRLKCFNFAGFSNILFTKVKRL